MRSTSLATAAAGLASSVVLLLLWEGLGRWLGVQPVLLPLPSQILYELAAETPWYLGHAAYTLMTTMIGFLLSVVGGVLIGALIVGSTHLRALPLPPHRRPQQRAQGRRSAAVRHLDGHRSRA